MEFPSYDFSKLNKASLRKEGETDEEIIEKHAILDILFDT